MRRLVAIGEVMVELCGGQENLWRSGFAGDTLNTLWYARAGLDPERDTVSYVTALGTDSMSDRILEFLVTAGIETKGIRRIEGRNPGLYMIEQKAGDRAFLYWRGQSAARCLADDEPSLRDALRGADMIYLSGITLAILAPAARERLLTVLQDARANGAILAFDPNIRPALWQDAETMRDVLSRVAGASQIVLPSFDDEARTFGDVDPAGTIARYLSAGAQEVAVKDGGRPVKLSDGASIEVPAVAEVVDATAAGDSFNGAYLAARLAGHTPSESARIGISTAQQVVAAPGACINLKSLAAWRQRAGSEGDGVARGARAATDFAQCLMPDWLKVALPPGGDPAPVVEALGDDDTPQRTTLVQCRTVFSLAHLYLVTGRPEFLEAARRIQAFVMRHLRDEDGGFRFAVATDGTLLDDPETRLRRSYDQSFALLALVTLRRADPTATSAADVDACWRFIETCLIEHGTGALWEDDRGAAGSLVRGQNPQMHMLEALLQAHEMTGEPVWLSRARSFVEVAEKHFIDPLTGAVREFVGEDLAPLDTEAGRRREPGHQFEWAWLLRRYAAFARDPAPLAHAERMQAFAETHGVRPAGPMAGAPYDAVDADGRVTEEGHLLWPLTEAGKLYAARALAEHDRVAADRAREIAETVFGRYFAHGAAAWVNRLDRRGQVLWGAALSRLLYHVTIFVTEGGRAGLWRLDGLDGRPIEDTSPYQSEEEKTCTT